MFAPQVMDPTSEAMHSGRLQRSNSFTWRAEAGLPPPPSEIDQYPHLHHNLMPSTELERARSPSAAFQPYDDLSQSEAMPMHAVTKHPKLKLKIVLANSVFEAGGAVSGMLEITSSTSQRLRLGEIAVELEAFEELSSRDHSATQIFLFNRTLFQGDHLPPSNAVLPSAPLHGHWTARRGRTTFPFSFHLPTTAPSSLSFAGNASLRYVLKGTVQTWWNDSKSLVTVRSDAFVVERWEDEFDPCYLEPVEALADTHVFMGGNGAVWLEAATQEQLFVAGSIVTIRAGVKNSSKRHMSGMKVSIARRLVFPISGPPGKPAERPSLGPKITDVVYTQIYKGPSYEFPPNEEVVVNLAVDIPRDVRTLRKTRLFEVHVVALVSVQMGNFAKDLVVEVPLFVAHPASVRNFSAGSTEPLPNLPRRSQSAMAQHGQHHQQQYSHNRETVVAAQRRSQAQLNASALQPDFSMARLEAFAAQRGWSPAPMLAEHIGSAPPSRPASAAANVGAVVSLPSTPQFFQSPTADGGIGEQIVWDANTPGWSPNILRGDADHAFVPPVPPPLRSRSAAPGASMYNLAPIEDRTHLNTGPRREPTADSTHLLHHQTSEQRHDGQIQATYRRASAPAAATHTSAEQQPQAQHLSTWSSGQPNAVIETPPPPLPHDERSFSRTEQAQQVPYVPSPSQLLGANGQPLGLATITEDSESNAGTVRSIRTLIGSVTRGDIDQFEAIAQRVQDGEEALKAMQAIGMEPDVRYGHYDRHQAQELDENEVKLFALQKSLPSPPSLESNSRSSIAKASSRVKAVDLFAQHGTAPAATVERKARGGTERICSPTALQDELSKQPPQRVPQLSTPTQGQGLAALESRLNVSTQSTSNDVSPIITGRKSEPQYRTTGPILSVAANIGRRSSSGSHTETSVIRAASMATAERERRAREDEEARQHDEAQRKLDVERKRRRQSELLAAAKQTTIDSTQKMASSTTISMRTGGERKEVDLTEQRKLNKEAVSRVAGWLSTSPNRTQSKQVGTNELPRDDPVTSPKTPSPSVLLEAENVQRDIVGAISDIQTQERASLSQDVRSIIDNSRDLPKHKPGTSLLSHPSAKRFSGEISSEVRESSLTAPSKKLGEPLKPSKHVNTVNSATADKDDPDVDHKSESRKIFEKKLIGLQSQTPVADRQTDGDSVSSAAPKYDTRSARGGRGGHVASVANMWASIAEGTDGHQGKDVEPVVTLRPKAVRSGAAPALDFSDRSERSGKKTDLSSRPLSIVNNCVKHKMDKTTGAPQFVNTTVPRAVFALPASDVQKADVKAEVPPATRQLSTDVVSAGKSNAARPNEPGKLKATRKITSDLIAAEARMRAGHNLAKGVVEALQAAELEDSAVFTALPMNGRNTTKPIGRDRLADLRSLWGS